MEESGMSLEVWFLREEEIECLKLEAEKLKLELA
jgi:hypothetical protein